jgi:hypothetical protein
MERSAPRLANGFPGGSMRPCPFSTSMWSFSLRFTTGGTSPRFLASTCRAMLRGNWIDPRCLVESQWNDVHPPCETTMRDDLPDVRPEEDVVDAVNIIHEARAQPEAGIETAISFATASSTMATNRLLGRLSTRRLLPVSSRAGSEPCWRATPGSPTLRASCRSDQLQGPPRAALAWRRFLPGSSPICGGMTRGAARPEPWRTARVRPSRSSWG